MLRKVFNSRQKRNPETEEFHGLGENDPNDGRGLKKVGRSQFLNMDTHTSRRDFSSQSRSGTTRIISDGKLVYHGQQMPKLKYHDPSFNKNKSETKMKKKVNFEPAGEEILTAKSEDLPPVTVNRKLGRALSLDFECSLALKALLDDVTPRRKSHESNNRISTPKLSFHGRTITRLDYHAHQRLHKLGFVVPK